MFVKKFLFVLVTVLFITSNAFAFNLDLIGTNAQRANVANFKGKIVVITFLMSAVIIAKKKYLH